MFSLQAPIALDPGVGGNCLATSGLRPADILVSTTRAGSSSAIRLGTGSVVSHAFLYAGNGKVLEAIGDGVVLRDIEAAIRESVLVVVYRVPHLTSTAAGEVVKWASSQVGKAYSAKGALLSADKILCRVVGPQPAGFFCSQLVIEAYKRADVALTALPSQCVTPGDVVNIATERLTYIGHLKGDPSWFPIVAP